MAKRTEAKKTINSKAPAEQQEVYTYEVDKMTFIVTPVHNKESEKSIHDLMLSLMKREVGNP